MGKRRRRDRLHRILTMERKEITPTNGLSPMLANGMIDGGEVG